MSEPMGPLDHAAVDELVWRCVGRLEPDELRAVSIWRPAGTEPHAELRSFLVRATCWPRASSRWRHPQRCGIA